MYYAHVSVILNSHHEFYVQINRTAKKKLIKTMMDDDVKTITSRLPIVEA